MGRGGSRAAPAAAALPWHALPDEVWEHIFSFLPAASDRGATAAACRWLRAERRTRRRPSLSNCYAASPQDDVDRVLERAAPAAAALPWHALPGEVWERVFSFLPADSDRGAAVAACRSGLRARCHPSLDNCYAASPQDAVDRVPAVRVPHKRRLSALTESQDCQTKKCKQMQDNCSKSSAFGHISLVPACKKTTKRKVLFPYDEFLKLYNWKDLDVPPCGLMNCGNSCFANVVLQCLSCTRPLVAYLLGKDHSRECSMIYEGWCFLCELQCHIQKARESLHPFAPTDILSHLSNIGGNLSVGRQEDAHEFLRFVIDKMQSACLHEYGVEKAVGLSTQETNIIQHIFGGRLQSQVQCTGCGMVSNRYDNMMDLTVEIQGDAESLGKCLDQFTSIELLDGDNKYKCDRCNDYMEARKHLSVHQAPNILSITLKRFQSGRFGKLNKRVTFPMELDLTPYTSCTDGSDLYDLYAVVVHLDMLNASFFGHYICYIKGYHGRWYKIDDCKVMVVDEEEVHAQGAYMLLYSRRTARPRPLVTVDESVKQQQQCKMLPSNGQSHMILADATLDCESSLKTTLQQDCESNNESLHEMDIKDQESDLDLRTSIEDDKFIRKNLHIPGSVVSHALEDTRAPDSSADQCEMQVGPPLEGGPIMSSVQFGNSTSEASSEHSFAEQRKVPASCIGSVDYMDVDTEAGTEVERWDEQRPVLDDSVGRPNNNTSIPVVNGMSGEPKPSFPSGFFDKPSRKRSSFAEEDSAGSPRKLNGYCNGLVSSLEQGVLANSGSEKCNGDTPVTSSNGNYYAVNGDIQSSNDSLHADKGDVPFVSHGFEPRPYKVLSDSNNSWNRTSNGKPKACQGDMAFLPRGFLGRPSSRGISVKADDGLPFSNGASSSYGNGKSKSSNNSSSIGGFSPGFLTRHRRESMVPGRSSHISMDKNSNGAAVMPDHAEERVSDCTTNGSSFQIRAASDHLDENGLAILTTNNSCGQENDRNGTPSMNHDGSEQDGLRRRRTSKYFEQDGIDAQ